MPPILDPRQMSFWTAEERALWARISLLILRIYTAGGVAGEKALPANLRVLVNWDLVNETAINYLNNYRLRFVGGILATTRDKTIQAIEAWIRSGEPLPMLEARLKRWFSDERARNVASTEVTRIYDTGNEIAWRSTGFVDASTWLTSVDEKVCILCGPLDGITVPLGEGFTPNGPGEGPTGPPLHPRCRCRRKPHVSVEDVGKKIERILNA